VPIRVVIVDDHAMVAEAVAYALARADGMEMVGSARTSEQGVKMVLDLQPDVVLMDFRLPDGDGAAATEAILGALPETAVIMLTGSGGDEVLARAIEVGCVGFLHKGKPLSDVADAVRAAAAGEVSLDPAILATLLRHIRRPRDAASLSDRELEVLNLVGRGHTTDDVARQLYLSQHTVRNHIRHICSKLHAHSKLEAVAIAARQGVISLTDS
jgi:DNA-binding NarL/FixJ family response regulator